MTDRKVTDISSLVRRMEARDVETVHKLTLSVDWPDPLSFVQALVSEPTVEWYVLIVPPSLEHLGSFEKDEVVGSFELSLQGRTTGIGLIVLHAKLRGQGLGRALWEYGLGKVKEASPEASILLTASTDGARIYRHYGFSDLAIARDFKRSFSPAEALPLASRLPLGHCIISIDAASNSNSRWNEAIELNNLATSSERGALLNTLLVKQDYEHVEGAPRDPVLVFGVIDAKNTLVAWAAVYPVRDMLVIGPLVAPSLELAQVVISATIERALSQCTGPTSFFIELDERIDTQQTLGTWLKEEWKFDNVGFLTLMGCPAEGVDMKTITTIQKQWALLDAAHM